MLPMQPANSEALQRTLSFPPPSGPTVVAFSRILVLDIRDVDFAKQSFEADLDIELRVPGIKDVVGRRCSADPGCSETSEWPNEWRLERMLWIRNAVSEKRVERWYDPAKEGFRVRFLGRLSLRAQLEAFPFDVCKLPIELTLARSASDVRFQLWESRLLLRPNCPVRSMFDISPVMTHIVSKTDTDESVSGVEYPLQTTFVSAKRRSGYFVWNTLFPPLLIAGLAVAAAPLGVADLGSRLEIILALLVAVVSFKQGQATVLPVLPYNTLGDLSLTMQYASLALAAVLAVVSFLRGCRPGTHAAAVAHAVSVGPLCFTADVISSITRGAAPGCHALGLGPLPSDPVDGGVLAASGGCPYGDRAGRADAVLWLLWAGMVVSFSVFITMQAVVRRAWAALGPEWALKLASERDMALVEDLAKKGSGASVLSASPSAVDLDLRRKARRARRCACNSLCFCPSASAAELSEVHAEDRLRKRLFWLHRTTSQCHEGFRALEGARGGAGTEGDGRPGPHGGLAQQDSLGGQPALPSDHSTRSLVRQKQLEHQVGGTECGLCDTVCLCVSRDWMPPDRCVDRAAMAWNRARVWPAAAEAVGGEDENGSGAGVPPARCGTSWAHCFAWLCSAAARLACSVSYSPAVRGSRILSDEACVPVRPRMPYEQLGMPWDGVMDAVEGEGAVRAREKCGIMPANKHPLLRKTGRRTLLARAPTGHAAEMWMPRRALHGERDADEVPDQAMLAHEKQGQEEEGGQEEEDEDEEESGGEDEEHDARPPARTSSAPRRRRAASPYADGPASSVKRRRRRPG